MSTGISSPFKNSFGKIIRAPKTASARESSVSPCLTGPVDKPFFSYPVGAFCMPRAGNSFAASIKAVPTAPAETVYNVYLYPCTLFFLCQCSGGNPVEAAYAPDLWPDPAQQQYFVLQHHCTLCTVHVLNHYVYSNKPVLS